MPDEEKEITRDFKGIWIKKEIWLDDRLTALEKVVLAEIDSLDTEDGVGCYASNQYLAEFCKCSEVKISKTISKLIDLGYIYISSFNGRQREVKICKSDLQKIQGRLVKNTRQTCKKYKADLQKVQGLNNNINNNIIDYNNIDENFEKLWKMLKSTQYDRKSKVSAKRRKELYKMGDRAVKAIEVYNEVQNPQYLHRRDNFLNEIINNYLDKEVSDFKQGQTEQAPGAAYDLDLFEKMLNTKD